MQKSVEIRYSAKVARPTAITLLPVQVFMQLTEENTFIATNFHVNCSNEIKFYYNLGEQSFLYWPESNFLSDSL